MINYETTIQWAMRWEEAETDNKHGTRYRITHSCVDPNADELVQIG